MDPIGGDLARHDHEFDEVRWIPFDGAATMLTFETERALVARTAAELAAWRCRRAVRLRPRAPPAEAARDRRARPAGPRHAADRRPPRARRPADRVRRLADAGPVRLDHRGAPDRPRARSGCSTCRTWASSTSRVPTPATALAAALVSDPASLAIGRAHYSMICAPDGGIIDDLIVYRLAEARFLVVANAGNAADRVGRPRRAPRGLQGASSTTDRWRPACSPSRARGRSRSSRPLTDVDLAGLRYYAVAEGTVAGIPALVARTGYTGEDGFEVFVDTGRDRGALGRAARGGPARRRAAGRARRPRHAPAGGRDAALRQRARPRHEPVRGRPRAGRQARQGRRLRRPRGRSRRSPATGRRGGWSGSSSRAAGSRATAIRSGRASGAPASSRAAPSRRRSGVPIAMAYVAPGDAEPGTVVDVEIRDARVAGTGRRAAVLSGGDA